MFSFETHVNRVENAWLIKSGIQFFIFCSMLKLLGFVTQVKGEEAGKIIITAIKKFMFCDECDSRTKLKQNIKYKADVELDRNGKV